jgi:diaminohydroxyphosphoribosylaminopyrimidine deaminase/5-amino-6-(5-phosphoribosylamino)uracil reductase
MLRAVDVAERVHGRTSPNPWVGAVVVPPAVEGTPSIWFTGATAPPGGPHAEITALAAAVDQRIRVGDADHHPNHACGQ